MAIEETVVTTTTAANTTVSATIVTVSAPPGEEDDAQAQQQQQQQRLELRRLATRHHQHERQQRREQAGDERPHQPHRHGLLRRRAERAAVVYDYVKEHDRELTVHVGDVVRVVDDSDIDWWVCELADGTRGMLPSSCCTTDPKNYALAHLESEDGDEEQRHGCWCCHRLWGHTADLVSRCCTAPCCAKFMPTTSRILLLLILCSVSGTTTTATTDKTTTRKHQRQPRAN